jgi:hypothetical protein
MSISLSSSTAANIDTENAVQAVQKSTEDADEMRKKDSAYNSMSQNKPLLSSPPSLSIPQSISDAQQENNKPTRTSSSSGHNDDTTSSHPGQVLDTALAQTQHRTPAGSLDRPSQQDGMFQHDPLVKSRSLRDASSIEPFPLLEDGD